MKKGATCSTTDLWNWVHGHFHVAEEKGAELTVRCPFHEDLHPSAGVNVEKATFHCFACGSTVPGKLSEVAALKGWPAPPIGNGRPADVEYTYRGVDGKVLAVHRRYVKDGRKGFAWCDAQGNPGLRGKGIVLPLYRLPELTAALERGEVVAVCEGEKDADRVTEAGICATTCPGGAGQWRQIDTDVFPAGAEVLIFFDADVPGVKHRDMVAAALAEKGCTAKLMDLGFEVRPDHGLDISDWFGEPFRNEQDFLELIAKARPWGKKQNPYKLTTLADIRQYREPEFLIRDFLVRGAMHIIGGPSGIGKSILSLEAARSVIDGFPFLGRFAATGRGSVLYVDEENSPPLLRARLEQMGLLAGGEYPLYYLHFQSVRLDTNEGWSALLAHVLDLKPALLILDSLFRLHQADENSGEMAMVMGNIRRVTNEGETTTLIQHHHGRADRLRGHTDIGAAVDVEYALQPTRGGGLELTTVKSRIVPLAPLALKIVAAGNTLHMIATERVTEAGELRAAVVDILGAGEATAVDILEATRSRGITGSLRDVREVLRGLGGRVGIRTGSHRIYHYRLRAEACL